MNSALNFGEPLDKNRQRSIVFYGRVSTEHEAQLSALENQIQWYDDQAETVRMIYDMYLEGVLGTGKIAEKLTEMVRKNASDLQNGISILLTEYFPTKHIWALWHTENQGAITILSRSA